MYTDLYVFLQISERISFEGILLHEIITRFEIFTYFQGIYANFELVIAMKKYVNVQGTLFSIFSQKLHFFYYY